MVLSLVIYLISFFAYSESGSYLVSSLEASLFTFFYLIFILFSFFIYVFSFWVTGKLIDGKALFSHMMAAIFWTYLHILWFYVLMSLFLILTFLGEDSISGLISVITLITSLILAILSVFWYFSALIKSVSEVQRFSVPKAGLNFLFAYFFRSTSHNYYDALIF